MILSRAVPVVSSTRRQRWNKDTGNVLLETPAAKAVPRGTAIFLM
jgi:hypothetical protein